MPRRLAVLVPLGGALLAFAACDQKSSPDSRGPAASGTNPAAAVPASAKEVGGPLYAKFADPGQAKATRRTGLNADPVTIADCRLVVIEKEDVPSQKDGVIKDTRVKEGDKVKAGQQLAQVDDRLPQSDYDIAMAKLKAAVADRDASEATAKEAKVRYDRQLVLDRSGATSKEDRDAAKLLMIKYENETISKREAINLAERERDKARVTLEMYQIRSAISGRVKTVYRKVGEAVKSAPAYEPVFQIENLSRLRAEGLLEAQYLPRLRHGIAKVRIEPSQAESPVVTLIGHLQEITAVAVGKDLDRPLIASASSDGTIRVWDRTSRSERAVLRNPGLSPVRALACTPPGAEHNWCLSGSDDGAVRLWDLDAESGQPLREFKLAHHRPVTCVAFSPDGKFAASGSEDHDIYVWDPAGGEARYALPQEHHGGITALQFLPHSQLVSAGRDNTLRLWTLGEQDARLENSFPRRSGDVTAPGVSPDGTQVLFDQGKALRVLSLPGGYTEGVLQNTSGATNFTTFAQFGPDAERLKRPDGTYARMILTAGATEGRLQLWRAPQPGGRASELRQLITADRSPATCAAFSPDGSFLVTGTRGRQVLIWALPAAKEVDDEILGKITLIDGSVESSARQVRVWAELENPEERLLPGTNVDVVIYPVNK